MDAYGGGGYATPADIPDEKISELFPIALQDRLVISNAVASALASAGSKYIANGINTYLNKNLSSSSVYAEVSSWQEAEEHTRNTYNAVKYTYTDLPNGMKNRKVDGLTLETQTIHEVKYGYASCSSFIQTEVARDKYLLDSGTVKHVQWHFYRSQETGVGGPSGPLREALRGANIEIIMHFK